MNWSGFSFCDIIHPFVLPTRVCVVINSLLTFYKNLCLSSLTAPRDCIFHSNIKSSMNGLSTNQKRYCRTKLTTHFFSFRTVNMWNGLPDDVLSPTLNSFKGRIDRHCDILIFLIVWLSVDEMEVTWSVQRPTMAYFNLDYDMMMTTK